MQLTEKKLRVSANINMAYVINYLSKYCGLTEDHAARLFISSRVYTELCNLHSGLCTAMAPEVLFMFADEKHIDIPENDDYINGAFYINDKLQYTVNIAEGFRADMKIPPKSFAAYLKKHDIWGYISGNYTSLSPLKRSEVFNHIRSAV